MHEAVITRDGFERLNAELERLTGEGRRSVAERLRVAGASEANLAENAEYLDAREEQGRLERRIAVLEDRLRSARIVDPRLGNGRVDVGEAVDELLHRPPSGRRAVVAPAPLPLRAHASEGAGGAGRSPTQRSRLTTPRSSCAFTRV